MAEIPLHHSDEFRRDQEQRQQSPPEWKEKDPAAEVRLPPPEPSDAPWYPRFVNRINGPKPTDP